MKRAPVSLLLRKRNILTSAGAAPGSAMAARKRGAVGTTGKEIKVGRSAAVGLSVTEIAVLVGQVIGHEIDDDAQLPKVCGRDQIAEFSLRTERLAKAEMVGDGVAKVTRGARGERGKP